MGSGTERAGGGAGSGSGGNGADHHGKEEGVGSVRSSEGGEETGGGTSTAAPEKTYQEANESVDESADTRGKARVVGVPGSKAGSAGSGESYETDRMNKSVYVSVNESIIFGVNASVNVTIENDFKVTGVASFSGFVSLSVLITMIVVVSIGISVSFVLFVGCEIRKWQAQKNARIECLYWNPGNVYLPPSVNPRSPLKPSRRVVQTPTPRANRDSAYLVPEYINFLGNDNFEQDCVPSHKTAVKKLSTFDGPALNLLKLNPGAQGGEEIVVQIEPIASTSKQADIMDKFEFELEGETVHALATIRDQAACSDDDSWSS
jgi:hypothetical protein